MAGLSLWTPSRQHAPTALTYRLRAEALGRTAAALHRYAWRMPRTSAAKFVAPRAEQIVHRRRLSTAIERAVRDGVCWIAAPAGYGKTTAVADYLRSRPSGRVWYRTDEGDHDVASFFHYMT